MPDLRQNEEFSVRHGRTTGSSLYDIVRTRMASANFQRALSLVLRHEGGFVNDPHDPGGATNLGITIGTLSQVYGRTATVSDVRALDRATVAPIYRTLYWDPICGDALPVGVDYAAFDFCVNSGRGRAIPSLQRAVGVADDGVLGPITLATAKSRPPVQIIDRICADRLTFLRRLTTWPRYGKGWDARVESVQAEALSMVGPGKPTVPVEAKPLDPLPPPIAVSPKPGLPIAVAPAPTPTTPLRASWWSRWIAPLFSGKDA